MPPKSSLYYLHQCFTSELRTPMLPNKRCTRHPREVTCSVPSAHACSMAMQESNPSHTHAIATRSSVGSNKAVQPLVDDRAHVGTVLYM